MERRKFSSKQKQFRAQLTKHGFSELETSTLLLNDRDLLILSFVKYMSDHPIPQSYHHCWTSEDRENIVSYDECQAAREEKMQKSSFANLYNEAVANGFPLISPKELAVGWAMKGNEGNTHRSEEVSCSF